MTIELTVNGAAHSVDAEPDTPLLWVLRDILKLKGTKFSCGIGQCGACTVHIDGLSARSCSVPLESVGDADVTTIEGLNDTDWAKLQVAWISEQVPQCGYCQPGMIMAVASALTENPNLSDEGIKAEVTNICRCGTYDRILPAIRAALNT